MYFYDKILCMMSRKIVGSFPAEPTADIELGQELANRFIVEIGVPECSIVASDVAKDAHDFCSGETKGQEITLLLASEEFARDEVEVQWVSENFHTSGGYEDRLGLVP